MDRLGFVGLGLMGAPMARRAMAAGWRLTVCPARSRAAAEALIGQGAVATESVAEMAAGVDALVICVTDAEAATAVAEAALPALPRGALVLDATTSRPATSRALAAAARARGLRFADAPVTGGPPQAAEGRLTTFAGCDEADLADLRAVAGAWSQRVLRMGDVGAGHAAKLINNMVTQGTVALLAEAFAAARAQGLDLAALHAAMAGGAARSGTFDKTATPAMAGDYDGAAFSIANARKDLRYAAELMRETPGADPALAEAALRLLDAAADAGHGPRRVSRLLDPAVWDGLRRG